MELALAPIRVMEPAIIDRLRLAFPAKDFQIQRVPAVLTVDEFKSVVKITPFIGLAWMGLQPDRDAGREIKGVANWRLVLIVKASSTLEARFKGDRRDIGLDAMIDVASVLLTGCTFEGIGTCTVTRAEAIYADGWGDMATVLAQLDFDVRYTARASQYQLKTQDDFKQLNVSWLMDDASEPIMQDTIIREETNG